MIWLSWRQQRTETVIAASVLLLLATLLIPTGIQMAHAYDHGGLASCLVNDHSLVCQNAVESFRSRFAAIASFTAWFTLVPGLIGLLLAAPFVLELDQGTYRLAWTQSITRRRWIVSKLGLAVLAALVAAAILTLLVTWWREPLVHLDGRMEQSVFDSEGTVVFGYTLFALALALAAGTVWRRTAPALLCAFVGYFVARIATDTWLRQRLADVRTATWPLKTPDPPALRGAWIIAERPSDRLGHSLSRTLAQCVHSVRPGEKTASLDCLQRHGGAYSHAVYVPAGDFWPLQMYETLLYGGTAIVLLALTVWWTSRRVA